MSAPLRPHTKPQDLRMDLWPGGTYAANGTLTESAIAIMMVEYGRVSVRWKPAENLADHHLIFFMAPTILPLVTGTAYPASAFFVFNSGAPGRATLYVHDRTLLTPAHIGAHLGLPSEACPAAAALITGVREIVTAKQTSDAARRPYGTTLEAFIQEMPDDDGELKVKLWE